MKFALTFIIVTLVILIVVGDVLDAEDKSSVKPSGSHQKEYIFWKKDRRKRELTQKQIEKSLRCKRYTQTYFTRCTSYRNCKIYDNYNPCRKIYCDSCPTSYCRRRCPKKYTTPIPYNACECDRYGSISNNCDATGQCICKTNFDGKKCDKCKQKYWLNKSNFLCEQCLCNPDGSLNLFCNQNTGQCPCKPGVTGFKCDECKHDYYGNITTQCRPCDPCTKPGHHCDQLTGKCVCPENTEGQYCERCKTDSWGYEPGLGCKPCTCDSKGSTEPCDTLTGACTCHKGYEGLTCSNCTVGYHRFNEHCTDCKCDPRGSRCIDDVCQCNKNGDCDCKAYVTGKKCNQCSPHTFGLNKYKPKGCTECFCYGRSKNCQDSKYNWDKIRSTKLDLSVINCISRSPCYYLPSQFLGDITTSFGGFITVETQNNFQIFLKNPRGIVVENDHTKNRSENVKLDELDWRLKYDDYDFMPANCKSRLSRNCLMLVLQNVKDISIEPLHGEVLNITEVLMDFSSENLPIRHEKYSTVEKCECPPEYTGLSCQNPSPGYYRSFENPVSEYDRIIGAAKKCDCNGKSEECDPNTGHCKNCRDNTFGSHCELCAEGFYMDEYQEKCEPCLCPSATENNSKGCTISTTGFICKCKTGYKEPNCKDCKDGYYRVNGKCESCDCDSKTTTNAQCDPETGKCDCKAGFTGDKCSQCVRPREYVRNGICTPCDECTQLLFKELDTLKWAINETLDQFRDGIGPPWDQLMGVMDGHKLLSSRYKITYEKVHDLLETINVPNLEAKIDKIEKYVGILKGDKNGENRVEKLEKSSKVLREDIENLDERVLNVVNNLNVFNNKHLNVSEALEEADEILNDIHDKSRRFNNATYEVQFKKCNDVYNKIQEVYKDDNISPNRLRELLSQLIEKLKNLNKINEEILKTAPLADHKNKSNRKRLDDLRLKIKMMEENKEQIESNLTDAKDKIIAASSLLEETKNVYESLKGIRPDYSKLRKRQLEKDTDYYDYLMDEVDDHLEKLQDTFDYYKGLFNFTNEEWRKINASVAYEEIVRQIEDVNLTANEAKRKIQEAFRILEPSNNDSIQDLAVLSQAYSDRLNHRIQNLKDIQPEYNDVKKKVDDLKYNILTTGKKNNDLNAILNNMKNELNKHWDKKRKIEDTLTKNENVSDHMQKILSDVNNMNITIQYNLFQNYKKYLNLFSKDDIDDLKSKYSPDLNDVNSNESTFDALKNIKIKKYNITNYKAPTDISRRLEELRGKIMEAKNLANSLIIFLDLTGCVRTYAVPETEVFEKFSFTFRCRSCVPLKLRIGDEDFLRFSAENYEIQADFKDDSRLSFGKFNATVNVKLVRYGPNLSIKIGSTVKIVKDVFKNDDTVTEIEVGDANNVGGTLYAMRYNREAMGLWNFKTNTPNSCRGSSDLYPVDNIDRHYWNGKGYAVYKNNALKSIYQYVLTFDFKTFDENSLLYLSYYEGCKYMALYIRDRRLHFKWNNVEVHTLDFPQIVSNGQQNKVTIKSLHQNGKQTIKLDLNDDSQNTVFELNRKDIFKFKKAQHLVAGVDPTFEKCEGMDFETRSFLGELKELSNNVKEVQSHGTSKLEEFKFNKAWFKPNSKLKLEFDETYNTLGFLLRPNATISSANVMNIKNLAKLIIKNQKLIIELPNNQKYTIENELIVPNKYHYIEFDVKGNVLRVNGAEKNVMFSSKGLLSSITFGDDFPSYIGGFYQLILNENRPQYLDQSSVKSFENVDIGREEPLRIKKSVKKGRKFSPKMPNEIMQKTESCTSISGTEPVKGAAKFGNKNNSYAKISVNFNLKKSFNLSFQFRTFYPQGVLIFAEGGRNHYLALQLENGKLKLNIKGKKEKRPKIPDVDVNDGKWHNLTISLTVVKKSKKMSITLDGASHVSKINNANLKPLLYMGGIPENLGTVNLNLPQFRGCIKGFSFNGKTHDYHDSTNVGQCFAKIEKGAYFGGDSYAVYQNNYEINSQFDVRFDFRTSEQNGVLLSISNSQNSPALSIELQNGALVMAVDMGNGITNNVSNNLNSEFALCNYKWHSVKTSYSTSELTVNVDGITKTWVIPYSDSADINAPLYIGGIADSAPVGTLKARENFKGCIRNVLINSDITDWTDMHNLHNIMLNSCPTE
ncbi:unnamed protein product [Brassicogethes aeneus]|uniref:Uncharacterized protein n=1 Tax=Brassicogethes aeneus TaxID=1431903 RepID=A0A9P0B9X6_BRAAE|nr:unnamed protein product [Brassicogethes aeneus]